MTSSSRVSNPSLQVGHFIYRTSKVYRILAWNKDGALSIRVENTQTRETEEWSIKELFFSDQEILIASTEADLQAKVAHQLPLPNPSSSVQLPETLLKQADRIIGIVQRIEDEIERQKAAALLAGEKFSRTRIIKGMCATLKIAYTRYYAYRKRFNRFAGDRAAIAGSLRRSTWHHTTKSRAELHFIDTLILRYFLRKDLRLTPRRLLDTASDALKRTQGLWLDPTKCPGDIPHNLVEELLIDEAELPMQTILANPEKKELLTRVDEPKKTWLYPYLKWFVANAEEESIDDKYGEGTYESHFMVFDTFLHRATLPLQYVFADHLLLKVFSLDEETRTNSIRLWLTVLIDAYTRCILGMVLLPEHPCIESIQSALAHSVWPKELPPDWGGAGEWVCFGIPQMLFLDNAWAHQSHSLVNLARLISQAGRHTDITLVWRPPYKGRYGALIERYFRNLSEKIRTLPGSFFPGDVPSVRDAAKTACLLDRDIYSFILKMIVSYQNSPHSELGNMTPNQKWTEAIESLPILVPARTEKMQRLFWREYTDTREIGEKGIQAFGLDYSSPQLSSAQRIGMDGKPVEYGFRYEPSNISRLALFRDGEWAGDVFAKQLRLPNGAVRPVSMSELAVAKMLARKNRQLNRNPNFSWLDLIREVEELSEKRTDEKRKANRKPRRTPPNPQSPSRRPSAGRAMANPAPDQTDRANSELLVGFLGR